MFKEEREFDDPNDALRHYYDEFNDGTLQLIRFSVPSKYKSFKSEHKVFLIISLKDVEENPEEQEPDWFFRQKLRDYYCTCQNGQRKQGSCVHVQVALYGATLTLEEKERFRRKQSLLSSDTFKNTFDGVLDDEAEEGEEYLSGKCEIFLFVSSG